MKTKTKVGITLLFSILFLTTVYYEPVLADTYLSKEVGSISYTYNNYNDMSKFSHTHLSTMKNIFVFMESNKILNITIIDFAGNKVFNYEWSFSAHTGVHGFSIGTINNTHAIIFTSYGDSSGTDYSVAYCMVINMINYSHIEDAVGIGGGYWSGSGKFSNVILDNDDNVYCFITKSNQGGGVGYSLLKWTGTNLETKTTSEATATLDVSSPNPIISLINENTFFIWRFYDTTNRYVTTMMYDFDDGKTLLSDAPLPYCYNRNQYFSLFDYGYETQNVGGFLQYYFYIYYSSGDSLGAGNPDIDIKYFRQVYNNTIESATLLYNSITSLSVSPSAYATDSNPIWSVTIPKQNSHTEFYLYYPNFYGFDGSDRVYNTYKMIIELGNNTESAFYDTTTTLSVDSFDVDYELPITYFNYDDLVYREISSNFEFCCHTIDGKTSYIFYGMPSSSDFFSAEVSYLPNESPLYTHKTYTWSVIIYNNGAYYSNALVLFYVDDTLVSSKVTNVVGLVTQSLSFSSIGQHNLTINIFKYNHYDEAVLNDVSLLTLISSSATPTPPESVDYTEVQNSIINVAVDMLPLMITLFAPAFTGAGVAGIIGFIAGMDIGVVIAVKSSLLPQYYIYFALLITVLAVVYGIRNVGGNNSGVMRT